MIFGKKQRYIEVFQCSGMDGNLFLRGGNQGGMNPPPGAPGGVPHGAAAYPPQLLKQQLGVLSPPATPTPPPLLGFPPRPPRRSCRSPRCTRRLPSGCSRLPESTIGGGGDATAATSTTSCLQRPPCGRT